MKKLIVLLLVVTLSFSMIACNQTNNNALNSETTEDSTTTETTTTEATTTEYVFEGITYEIYAHALEVAFNADKEDIIYVTNDGDYIEHAGFSLYYPYVVSTEYGTFVNDDYINMASDFTFEGVQAFEPDGESTAVFIDEEEYRIIYTYVTGIDDLVERFGDETISFYDFAEDFHLDADNSTMIDLYYFSGNQYMIITVLTDNDEGIEAMDTFISELGLPEV